MSTVLVTGASRGIGAATARALSYEHDVILVGRDTAALEAVARDCRSAYPVAGSARTVTADLTTADGVSRTAAGLDSLDGLVHCAGVAELDRIDGSNAEQWRRAYEVNVVTVVELTRVLLPALRAARGHVVVVNSGAGKLAKPGWGAYSASKFALRAVTDTLRGEEPDLRVTAVYPGRVDTDMQRSIVQTEGNSYNPDAYLRADSVATVIRQALGSTRDAHPSEIDLRPRPR